MIDGQDLEHVVKQYWNIRILPSGYLILQLSDQGSVQSEGPKYLIKLMLGQYRILINIIAYNLYDISYSTDNRRLAGSVINSQTTVKQWFAILMYSSFNCQ